MLPLFTLIIHSTGQFFFPLYLSYIICKIF
nr:MAG TPA: hypothetical protein [Caudoviricetes sp.]